jgi:hypothetical protein
VHVGDRDVRLVGERVAQQILGIAGQRHDLEPRLGEDPRDPLAQNTSSPPMTTRTGSTRPTLAWARHEQAFKWPLR